MPESNIPTNNPLDRQPDRFQVALSVDVAIEHDSTVDKTQIRQIVSTIINDAGWFHGEISVAVVDDATIHQLNRQYLDHDYATDVLSFVLEQDSEKNWIAGEIIVSADTASAMADEHGVKPIDELLLYIIHGSLHLAGLDDKTPIKRRQMRQAELQYTDQFHIQYVAPQCEEELE